MATDTSRFLTSRLFYVSVVFALPLMLTACSDDDCGASSSCAGGEACSADDDCLSGVCVTEGRDGRFCATSCDSDANCPAEKPSCSNLESGANICVETCTEENGTAWLAENDLPQYTNQLVCIGGQATECALQGPDDVCAGCCDDSYGNDPACNCAPGTVCIVRGSQHCEPPRALGEPCDQSKQCASGSCSTSYSPYQSPTTPVGHCEFPASTSCENLGICSACLYTDSTNGWKCHRPCGEADPCPSGEVCIWTPGTFGGNGLCYDRCTSVCEPGYTCRSTTDGTIHYCDN